MATSIIEALRDYLCTCPLLGDSKINVDYLPDTANEYSVDTVPGSGAVKEYISGASVQKHLFVVRSVCDYGGDTLQQIENTGIFERLRDWMRRQSLAGNLPQLPAGKTAQKIEALTPGYLTIPGADVGKYQIQCALTYYQSKE